MKFNVIVVIADTVRPDYCGCYGNAWVSTPHMDALGEQAARFTHFFTASFPTGPMRKDLLSGRFTFTYTGWAGAWEEKPALYDVAKERGYTTAFIGDTATNKMFEEGFDHFEIVGSRASGLDRVPEQVELPAHPRKLRIPMARIQQIVRNAMGWQGDEDRRAARTIRAAYRWLEEQYGQSTPFLLLVDTFDPHEPWDAPRYYMDQYDPGYEGDELMEPAYEPAEYATEREIQHMRCMYAGKLTMVDRWLGYFLEGIKRMGFEEDTAILFTSDHGFYLGEHHLIGKVHLDREGVIVKRWPLYKTIARAPLLIKIPHLTDGTTHDAFCQPPDLMPTILDLIGAPIPPTVQGTSLLPILQGETEGIRPFAISSLTYVQDAEVRCPTSFRTKDHLYIYGGDESDSALYNVRVDEDEMHNIIDAHPDIARTLHTEYVDFLSDIGCPTSSLEARRAFPPRKRTDLPYRRTI